MNFPAPIDHEEIIGDERWSTKKSILIAYLGLWDGSHQKRLYLFKTKSGRYFLQEEKGKDFARIWRLGFGEAVKRYNVTNYKEDAVAVLSFHEAFPHDVPDA